MIKSELELLKLFNCLFYRKINVELYRVLIKLFKERKLKRKCWFFLLDPDRISGKGSQTTYNETFESLWIYGDSQTVLLRIFWSFKKSFISNTSFMLQHKCNCNDEHNYVIYILNIFNMFVNYVFLQIYLLKLML